MCLLMVLELQLNNLMASHANIFHFSLTSA